MLCPVYVTTIETPARLLADYSIPFKIVIRFRDPHKLMDYMQGDMRVELLVDGVACCGLKFYREAAIKAAAGFQLEFVGYRVGRTEELPFVFLPLPKMIVAAGSGAGSGACAGAGGAGRTKRRRGAGLGLPEREDEECEGQEMRNHGLAWVRKALATKADPDPVQVPGRQYPYDGLYPPAPLGVPPGVSALQLVFSVGQRRRTIDKYLMGPGDVQMLAAYHPPAPPVSEAMDVSRWRAPHSGGGRRPSKTTEVLKLLRQTSPITPPPPLRPAPPSFLPIISSPLSPLSPLSFAPHFLLSSGKRRASGEVGEPRSGPPPTTFFGQRAPHQPTRRFSTVFIIQMIYYFYL